MGRSYYYFAASLPMIHWNGKLPIETKDFLLMASRLLREDDDILIKKLLADHDDIETNNTVACSWIRFNRNFRNERASFRAKRAHKDPLKFIRGTKEDEPFLREIVYEASKMPDLLEAEKLFDRTCWQFLDDLVGGHYYDLEFLICYGLKLKILERHQEHLSLKGNDIFDSIRTMELPISWAAPGI